MVWRRASGEPTAVVDRPRRVPQLARLAPSATAPDGAGVILGRRPARAGQRALIGGFFVAAAVVIVFAVALSASGGHSSAYEVAAGPLPAGTTIGAADLTTARMDLGGAAGSSAFRQSAPLLGRTLTVALPSGALIESSMLAAPATATVRPVSIAVDSDSLADLAAGQSVDVLDAPAPSSSGSAPPVVVVMRGATLLGIDRAGSGLLSSSTDSATVVVTLGVTNLSEAEQLVAAERDGTVELVQAEPSDGTGAGSG